MNGDGSRYRRAQRTCARCRNHSLQVLVRGHKRYCKYRHCHCTKCFQTAQRQKLMAVQTAQRRAEEEDRRRTMEATPSGDGGKPLYRPYEMSPDKAQQLSGPTYNESGKHAWEAVLLLQRMCGLPSTAAPLLHLLLTRVSSNPITIFRLFLKAKEDLGIRSLLGGKSTVVLPQLDGPAVTPSLLVPPTTGDASASAALYERVAANPAISVHGNACLTTSMLKACYSYPNYDMINGNTDVEETEFLL